MTFLLQQYCLARWHGGKAELRFQTTKKAGLVLCVVCIKQVCKRLLGTTTSWKGNERRERQSDDRHCETSAVWIRAGGEDTLSRDTKQPSLSGQVHRDCFEDPAVLKSVSSVLEEYRMRGSVKLVKTSEYESVVLSDSDLHGVVVTTPTPHHESYVVSALLAKKAVFCEKPLASDIGGVLHAYHIAERDNLPLYCAFQRRFDPGMSKLRHNVAEGKIG